MFFYCCKQIRSNLLDHTYLRFPSFVGQKSGHLAGLCSEFHEAKIKKLGELQSSLEALGEDLLPEPVRLFAESSFFSVVG